jgi:hypothetical protein
VAAQSALAGYAEIPRLRSACHDDGFGATTAFGRVYPPTGIARFQALDLSHLKLGALMSGLLLYERTKLVTRHSIGKARKVFDALDIHQMTAGSETLHHQGRVAQSRRKQRGGQPCNSGSDDGNVIFGSLRHFALPRSTKR